MLKEMKSVFSKIFFREIIAKNARVINIEVSIIRLGSASNEK
jgi:hypothetical protein